MSQVYNNFIQAHQGQEHGTREVAKATFLFVEELVLIDGLSIRKAAKAAHVDLVENYGIARKFKTLADQHRVCSWLMAETGSVHWVPDRTYSEHKRAMEMGWKRARLIIEAPKLKRQGFRSRSAYARIKGGLTETANGLTILDAEIEVSNGATKKQLVEVREQLLAIPGMRERFTAITEGTS